MREKTFTGLYVAYCIGELGVVGVAYLIPNWRYVSLYFLAIPMLLINFGIYLVYESPKYVHERDTNKAFQILNKIAKVNKREPLKINALQSMLHQSQETSYSYSHLFKYKSLRLTTILACFVFFSTNSIYYGVTYSITKIGFNIYINAIIIASAETLANISAYYFIPIMKRKLTATMGLGICSILLISFQFIQSPNDCEMCAQAIVQVIFAAVVRFCISFTQTIGFVYVTELYPTVVRNLAFGLIFSVCASGSIASSYFVGRLSALMGVDTMVIFGMMGLIGFICTFPLKETLNKPLEDQIEELKQEQEEIIIEQQHE